MSLYKVSVTADANNDISELALWYAELVDEASAKKFTDEVARTIASLSDSPKGHPILDDDETIRRVNMRNHKVSIVYYVNDDRLEVIAIRAFHQMQDPKTYLSSIKNRITLLDK